MTQSDTLKLRQERTTALKAKSLRPEQLDRWPWAAKWNLLPSCQLLDSKHYRLRFKFQPFINWAAIICIGNQCVTLSVNKRTLKCRLTGHSVGSIWDPEYFSLCLLNDTALNHPPPPSRKGLAALKKHTHTHHLLRLIPVKPVNVAAEWSDTRNGGYQEMRYAKMYVYHAFLPWLVMNL